MSNIVAHTFYVNKTDGLIATVVEKLLNHILLSHPESKSYNFYHLVGLNFIDNPYERIIFQNVEAERSSHAESIWLKYFFYKLRLCMSNLESSRNDLVVFS